MNINLIIEAAKRKKEDWKKWNATHKRAPKNKSADPVKTAAVRGSKTPPDMTPEANASSTAPQLLRNTAMKCSEAARILSKTDASKNSAGVMEGPRVKVVLISEGLGNRKDLNYYGPEAIDSAPSIFEGKPCFLNHMGESEQRNRPEGDVQNQCGYFKNCKVELIDGQRSCTGELHFDLSESGRLGYEKALTSLHYKSEFPNSDRQYVGLSINASGDYKDSKVSWQGEVLEVNYVTNFTTATSCDIVTLPARGGKFLALVESVAGAITKRNKEEVSMKKEGLKNALEAAQSALLEADKEKDLAMAKTKTAEAKKLFDAFFKEAESAQDDNEEAGDPMDGEEEPSGDSHTTITHKIVKKTGKAAVPKAKAAPAAADDECEADDAGKDEEDDMDEKKESQRIAVTALAKEAGLKLKDHQIKKLVAMPFSEAKREIENYKDLKESIVAEIAALNVPAGHGGKMNESGRAAVTSNDDLFVNLAR